MEAISREICFCFGGGGGGGGGGGVAAGGDIMPRLLCHLEQQVPAGSWGPHSLLRVTGHLSGSLGQCLPKS